MPKPASQPSPQTAPVIATRTLKVAGSRRKAVVTLRMPVDCGDDLWQCAYRISSMEGVRLGYGVDAIQAIQGALVAIRRDLDQTKGRYTWVTDKRGEHGFWQQVVHAFGPAFDDHIEQVIEREFVDYVDALQREQRQRRRDANKRKGG